MLLIYICSNQWTKLFEIFFFTLFKSISKNLDFEVNSAAIPLLIVLFFRFFSPHCVYVFFVHTYVLYHFYLYCRGYYFLYPIGSDTPPMVVERSWVQKPFHYDNCFMAMLTLFAVQTSEGWVA